MTVAGTRPQRRRHRDAVRHDRRGQGPTRARQVPVPRHEPVDERHPQPLDLPRLLRRDAGDDPRARAAYDGDHPAVLVGTDDAPTPVEYLLHAIAACLTAGIANIAAAAASTSTRSTRPSKATSTSTASSVCRTSVRNGYQQIRVAFTSTATTRDEARQDRRAVPRPLGRLRRADERLSRHDQVDVRLTTRCPPPPVAATHGAVGGGSPEHSPCTAPTPSSSAPARPDWRSVTASRSTA